MSNYDFISKRHNGRTLLVVEGEREKEELFHNILRSYPEINISKDSIEVYRTKIYDLYAKLKQEYDDDWSDVDLPFVISKDREKRLYKRDYTNIYLIFDYERHDPDFSEDKILKLQECFNDSADNGRLYINYPMVESYLDICTLPFDISYRERQFPVNISRGSEYKKQFSGSNLSKLFGLRKKIEDLLDKNYCIHDDSLRITCCDELLSAGDDRENKIQTVLKRYITAKNLHQACKHLSSQFIRLCPDGVSYWEHLRTVFNQLIHNNVCKASFVQNGQYNIEYARCAEVYFDLDLYKILEIQNDASHECESGFIWVLNTSLFLVIEYNSSLLFT